MLHTPPLFEFCKDAVYAKAMTSFAVIAEHEIKTHVFDSFLELMKDPGFAASARREKNKFEKDALLTFLFARCGWRVRIG